MEDIDQKHKVVAQAVEVVVKAIVGFGLIIAAFYAKSHGVDDSWFFLGAIFAFASILL